MCHLQKFSDDSIVSWISEDEYRGMVEQDMELVVDFRSPIPPLLSRGLK